MRSPKFRLQLLYVVGSISFLLLPLLFAPGTPSWEMFQSSHLRRDMVCYALILGFYFLNKGVLIPRFYFQKKHFTYWGILALLVLVIVVLPTLLLRHHPHFPRRTHIYYGIHLFSFSHPFFVYLVAVFFSMAMAIQNRWKQTEREKLRAELAYLKAQINPHFLFNSLNSIYALAIEKSDLAPEAVLKLSGLMRYVLAESDQETVSVQKEIEYLSDYIALQKIRLGNTALVEYSLRVSSAGERIVPLLMIPFFENAFKHGVNAEEDSRIHIDLVIANGVLDLKISNNKMLHRVDSHLKSGIGLANTRDRLQSLYPHRHKLVIEEDEHVYTVYLTIQL